LFGVDPSSSNFVKLVILYESVTMENTESLSKLNTTFLQIGNLTVPPSDDWMFCVSGVGYDDCFAARSSIMKSLIVSLPSLGNYSMKAFNDAVSGFLETREGVSIFSVASNRSFIAECYFVPIATVSASPRPTVQFSASGVHRQTGAVADFTAFRATAGPSGSQKPAESLNHRFPASSKNGQTDSVSESEAFRATAAPSRSEKPAESLNHRFPASDRNGRTDSTRGSEAFQETAAFIASSPLIPIGGNNARGLSWGMIAGVAVASVAFLVIVIAGGCWMWNGCGSRRGCKGKRSRNSPDSGALKVAEMTLLDWEALAVGKRDD
jgi:hypothetical protein